MKGVQCYELFGGIALKIHTFSFSNIHMKIATLNCRGLNKDAKILHLLHDADNYRLNVTSLQETHLKVENFTSHTSPK